MLGAPEDLSAIRALSLEHRARVVQSVGEDMQRSVSPRDEPPIIPDHPLQPVVGFFSHDALLLNTSIYGGLPRFVILCLAARHPLSSAANDNAVAHRAQPGKSRPCARYVRAALLSHNNRTKICQYG